MVVGTSASSLFGLALMGLAAVCENTHVYLYIYGVKPSIKTTQTNIRMFKVTQISADYHDICTGLLFHRTSFSDEADMC